MSKKFKNIFTLVMGIAVAGLFQSASADWTVNDGGISAKDPQDIVISLQSNPMSNPEMACLAVTFARSLSGKANVTLFVTLDGVTLADESVVSRRRFKCEIPSAFPEEEEVISLEDNLLAFINTNHNNMVVCPICWNKRYPADDSEVPVIPVSPDYGVLPSASDVEIKDALGDHWAPANAIGKMMLDAEKILDF